MSPVDADIAIVGAGPVGQALALALAQSGFDVALVDAAAGCAQAPTTPDLRVFALSPASIRLLDSVDAWPVPLAHRACAYRRMQVWERDPAHGITFDAAQVGLAQLGFIVEHAVLQHALAGQVATAPRIRSCWNARIAGLAREPGAVRLELETGDSVRARLVVGADGAGSPVRTLAGISTSTVDYGQRGLVANIRTAVAHDRTARQRFLPDGPLALLPLADGASSIVWSLPTHSCERLEALTVADFERELAVATGGVLGTVQLEGDRASFPLMRRLAATYHADRIVLVGDAAHVVHPLAGQGLNLGFLDVAALADVLATVNTRKLDPGDETPLARYARWRQGDNALAARAFEGIDRLYRAGGDMAHGVRMIGQRLVDGAPFMKRRFIRHASGLGGRVPSRCLDRHDGAVAWIAVSAREA
jgi:ubiquinone biosynthesis UbiH/UbiF/VisC/COQ6 family hydroxylase